MLGRYFLATDSWVRFVTGFSSFIVLVFSCVSVFPLTCLYRIQWDPYICHSNIWGMVLQVVDHCNNLGILCEVPMRSAWSMSVCHTMPAHATPCESIFLKLNHFDRCCDLTNVSLRLKHLCVCWCCKCQEREERFCDARTKRFPEMMRPPLVTCKGVETCWNIKLYSFRIALEISRARLSSIDRYDDTFHRTHWLWP